MDIEFTQFLMPDGRQKKIIIDRPDDICELAEQLKKNQCRLEIEMLTTGVISITVDRNLANGEIQSLAHEICTNGPAVPIAIDKLINDAFKNLN